MRINLLSLLLFLVFFLDGCSDANDLPVPGCVNHIFPHNGALVPIDSTIIFSWSVSPKAHSYDVYLGAGADEPTLIASDLTDTRCPFTIPSAIDVNYTWYAQPKNANGVYMECTKAGASFKSASLPPVDDEQLIVDVLVLNYDPDVHVAVGTKKLHEYYNWGDPRVLAQEYMNDVHTSSRNLVKYNIVEWRDLNEFPLKADGFRYTQDTYTRCYSAGAGCHSPDDLHYTKIFEEQHVIEAINDDVIDELWIFGAPYFGFWEAAMAGPGAFYVNGGVFEAPTKKAFAIMGFSYERGPAEMMHNLCHRTEATMSLVSGGWRAEELTTPWANFAANDIQSGTAAVGTCHYPPNSIADYDYANFRYVSSSADDWYLYPLATGKRTKVNSETWGPPDYQRTYLNWWFNHLPHRAGTAPDGNLNNWWRYIFDFNETIL